MKITVPLAARRCSDPRRTGVRGQQVRRHRLDLPVEERHEEEAHAGRREPRFKDADTEGGRPLAMEKLTIELRRHRINTKPFAKCTASKIEEDQSDKGCPRGSLVATGFARNIAGNITNRKDASIRCYLTLRLYNSGPGKMALFVKGGPQARR